MCTILSVLTTMLVVSSRPIKKLKNVPEQFLVTSDSDRHKSSSAPTTEKGDCSVKQKYSVLCSYAVKLAISAIVIIVLQIVTIFLVFTRGCRYSNEILQDIQGHGLSSKLTCACSTTWKHHALYGVMSHLNLVLSMHLPSHTKAIRTPTQIHYKQRRNIMSGPFLLTLLDDSSSLPVIIPDNARTHTSDFKFAPPKRRAPLKKGRWESRNGNADSLPCRPARIISCNSRLDEKQTSLPCRLPSRQPSMERREANKREISSEAQPVLIQVDCALAA